MYLEGQKNIPGEDEDCLQGGVWLWRTHYGDQVGDAQQGDNDDQGLGCSQVHILCLVVTVTWPQLGYHNLPRIHQLEEYWRNAGVETVWIFNPAAHMCDGSPFKLQICLIKGIDFR